MSGRGATPQIFSPRARRGVSLPILSVGFERSRKSRDVMRADTLYVTRARGCSSCGSRTAARDVYKSVINVAGAAFEGREYRNTRAVIAVQVD